jgi:hypothetical protein
MIPRGFALIFALSASLLSVGVQASPMNFGLAQTPGTGVVLVRGFCGLGFHRGPYGYCVRNGTLAVPPVVVTTPTPVVVSPAPVVVTPSPVVVAPVAPVVAPIVCPYGYVLGPYGRCLLY